MHLIDSGLTSLLTEIFLEKLSKITINTCVYSVFRKNLIWASPEYKF